MIAEKKGLSELSKNSGDGGVNTPKMDEKTLAIGRRAIENAAQAVAVGDTLEEGCKTRNEVNAVIVAKYDGEQPFSDDELRQNGEDWRNNFPTGFMSGIVDRIVPVPMSTIDNARYLTNATLDTREFPDEPARKSEVFQTETTRTIRRWRGWRPFCYSLCKEDILIGYAITAAPDKYEWRPSLYRSDEGFLPDGTGQHAETVQAFSANQDVMIHEFTKVIADKEVADEAGWDVEECVKSINNAMPKSGGDPNKPRTYEDVIKEGNLAMSYTNGAKVIQWRHVLVVEPNTSEKDEKTGSYLQKVSRYIYDRQSHKLLFSAEDEYDSMADVIALFTLESGNGKFYGSRGLGKMLVNLHIAIERARNIACDQLEFAGLKILTTSPKSAPSLQLRVRHPFAIVQTDGTFAEENISANVDEFIALDNKLTSIAEQAANAYIPNKLNDETGSNRTATEAAIDNARDQQAKAAYLSRFWGQFGELITLMQKKLCDPETIDPEAKALQKRLKDAGLSVKEIEALANTPATEVVQDMAAAENRSILTAAEHLEGDPNIDQTKLRKRKVTAMTNPQIADELILPDGIDPTIEAENIRQQLMEIEMFMLGTSMPVSPRDNHMIHLKVLRGELEDSADALAVNARKSPAVLDHVSASLAHMQAHIDMAKGPEGKNETDELKSMQAFVDEGEKVITKLAADMKREQEHQAKQAQALQAAQIVGERVLAQRAAAGEPVPTAAAGAPPAPEGGAPAAPITPEPIAQPAAAAVAPNDGAEVPTPPIPPAMDIPPLR